MAHEIMDLYRSESINQAVDNLWSARTFRVFSYIYLKLWSNRRDDRVVNLAVCASLAAVPSRVDAALSRAGGHGFDFRAWLAGYFKEVFYGFLSSRQVNAEVDIRPYPTDPWYLNFRNTDL